MENENTSIKPIATNYGLYYALFSIAVIVILYVTNMQKNLVIGTINVLGTVAVFVLAIIAYKKTNNNYLTLGQALKVGLGTAAIGGILIALYTYLHYTYIQPEFIEAMRQVQIVELQKQAENMSSEDADLAMKMLDFFSSAGFISTVSIIGSLIFGLIVSLIAGLVLKSE
ncbi:DUF4199 domain-containing protein [Olleya sp. HaHaR_3_96]|uniref:DUF4199 domain-containing protein n=1 Tax=Olleya sp. HaHaR_3_96 TaxID=2745560 RepID=UPI001C4ED0F0|nr:DUF4199 domain-containing protein [Olleya sp. HaHaR_3_96]QXP59560.1 DUF4199 domain-containing protein [Olleya sp. HaHaR_3_96]